MNLKISIGIIFIMLFISCVSPSLRNKTTFLLNKNEQGFELLENGKPVFFYQKLPKTSANKYICNNYIHPLYSLKGDTITEEFPPDHLFHRGVFWAWHQLYINNQSIGDGWVLENISQEVVDIRSDLRNSMAKFDLKVLWKSSLFLSGNPFIEENTTIVVNALESDIRKIDFKISLKALTEGVQIGGSDDVKGYGGFCIRTKLPDNLVFTSENGPVKPQNLQLEAGPWMDFSGDFKTGNETGVTILCHPSTPNYPAPWILRQKTSMQNIVFPGRERTNVSMDKPLVLRYRLIIHDGNASSLNISKLQEEYAKINFNY